MSVASLYTIVCDFAGGTYCSQLHAESEREAVLLWSELLAAEKYIKRRSAIVARNVLDDLNYFEPVALRGLVNIWQFPSSVGTGARTDIIMINIVRTIEQPSAS